MGKSVGVGMRKLRSQQHMDLRLPGCDKSYPLESRTVLLNVKIRCDPTKVMMLEFTDRIQGLL